MEQPKLRYLAHFVGNCTEIGVPLHAVTHHEYIDVDQDPTAPASADRLDLTARIADAVVKALAPARARGNHTVQLWAGEIGPHNGKSPGCDHTSMRWANWGDTFWYSSPPASHSERPLPCADRWWWWWWWWWW